VVERAGDNGYYVSLNPKRVYYLSDQVVAITYKLIILFPNTKLWKYKIQPILRRNLPRDLSQIM
jgi:hypothetical protein